MPIRLRSRARTDLADIYKYSVARWGVARADRYIDDLTDTLRLIEQRRVIDQPAGVSIAELRKERCESHVIYFQRVAGDVHVVRILHERMDPFRHLP